MERKTPSDWVWAYHVTQEEFLPQIAAEGLRSSWHPSVPESPVLFVEPDLEEVSVYYREGMAILRFKTPGFGTTRDGEYVLFSPDPPYAFRAGEHGVIPPERIQVLKKRKFAWLVE